MVRFGRFVVIVMKDDGEICCDCDERYSVLNKSLQKIDRAFAFQMSSSKKFELIYSSFCAHLHRNKQLYFEKESR